MNLGINVILKFQTGLTWISWIFSKTLGHCRSSEESYYYLLTRRVVQNIFAWSETCFGVTIVSKATFGWWWMAWLLAEIQFWSEFGWSKPHFHDHLWPFIGGLLPRGQWAASAWQNVPQNDWGLRAANDSQWNLQFENGSCLEIIKHILALYAKLVRSSI